MMCAMQFTMYLLPIMMLGSYMVVITVQLQCDPETQYEQNGECCNMCGPGTAMIQHSTCKEPQCEECKENEYQEKYTKAAKCEVQPYCDPHKNFEVVFQQNKKLKTTCKCKEGFHCSTACLSCVQNTACQPGSGAKIKDPYSDTVCSPCPAGTYSNISSWNSKCIKWTECESGYHVDKKGTSTSDNICVKTPRTHLYLWIVLPLLGVAVIVLLFFYLYTIYVKDKKKTYFCVESHQEEEQNKPFIKIEAKPLEPQPIPEQESTQEEGPSQEPEENVDEGSLEPGVYTDNGNFVVQERGKSVTISRQESQTCTVIESI